MTEDEEIHWTTVTGSSKSSETPRLLGVYVESEHYRVREDGTLELVESWTEGEPPESAREGSERL